MAVERNHRPTLHSETPNGAPNGYSRPLTERELEICGLIAEGATNKEIAVQLSIAERTVKAHLTSIFQKLGLSNRVQLAIYSLQPKLRRAVHLAAK